LGKIAQRLEVLGGYLVAYLNLDEVIRIIREEDDPKAVMMARWALSDPRWKRSSHAAPRTPQAEEIEIRTEFDALVAEKAEPGGLVASEERQWKCVAFEIAQVRKTFGPDTPLGKRRTGFADAPDIDCRRLPAGDDSSVSRYHRAVRKRDGSAPCAATSSNLGTLTFKEGDAPEAGLPRLDDDKAVAVLHRR
jgi:topoisomerase-4 subunit A